MKKFSALIFILFCFLSVFAFDLDIPLKNFEVRGVSVDKISLESEAKKVTVFVTVSSEYLADFNDIKLEKLSRLYLNSLISLNIDFAHLNIMLRTDQGGEYKHVTEFLPKLPPVPKKEEEEENGGVPLKTRKTKSLSPQVQHGNITGALSGKTLFVSAGHGWVYNLNYDDSGELQSQYWGTQRDISQGMREDDSNAEMVSYFLIPYLQNAGGAVFSARERDRQEKMVIIDDGDGTAYAAHDGIYEESGSWSDDGTDGYGYGRTVYPIERDVNPLRSGKYRFAPTGNGAWARWTANIPEDGFYHVYVSYRVGENRTDSAVYTIKHAGGSSKVTVNQQHHGSTWIDLGRFYFHAGMSKENGSVTVKDSGESGAYLVADAVRFGGGKGLVKRGESGVTPKVSGKPRWEEGAVHNIQFMGAPSGSGKVYHCYNSKYNDRDDDVGARSRWAAWENESSDDSLYIAIHSDAHSNTSAEGISSYIYSPGQAGGVGFVSGHAVDGSEDLADLVRKRILNSVKGLFNSNYKERGRYSAYFGEINPSNNNEMPSCLIELAYHTSPNDSAMLKNPKYRDIAMRGAYQGIVQYFAQKDGTEAVFLPGSPQNLRTKTNENGSVTLSWDAPESDYPDYYKGHPATGYYVQTSTDGNAFNDGVDVGNVLQFTKNFEQGKPVYFRVVAYNAGGVSFPSGVAAAVPAKHCSQILLVDGFERIDNALPRFNEGTSANHRYILEYINSFDYAKYYAPLISELGYSLDFTQRTNVSGMDLSNYDMILWFLGEQSTQDETFNHAEQTKIAGFIGNGGALFVSGAEIGWDLDYKGDANDKTFFNETLNTKYVSDESGLYTFLGIDDFSVISGNYDNGTYIYQAEYADVLAPFDENSGKTVLYYDNAKTSGAGILTKTDDKKVFVMGFPFETILEKDKKISVLQTVMNEFGITPKVVDDDPADSGTETPDEDSDSDSADSDSDDTPDEDADSDSTDSDDETIDDDTADTEDEPLDEDPADTGSGKPDEDISDSGDSADSSDSADTSDSSDPTDNSDSADSDDSADTSENGETGSSEDGKGGGCSLSVI